MSLLCASALLGTLLLGCVGSSRGAKIPAGARIDGSNDSTSTDDGTDGGTDGGDKPEMKKQVTKDASFVVYAPSDWSVDEGSQDQHRTIAVSDPNQEHQVIVSLGRDADGGDAVAVAKDSIKRMSEQYPDVQITGAMTSPEKNRVVFDGTYSTDGGAKEFRCWASTGEGNFSCSRIVAPSGKLAEKKQELLTVLSNVKAIKGAFQYSGSGAIKKTLVSYRLSDGSCSFKMPQDWKVQEIGKGQFVAYSEQEGCSFTSSNADCVTPALGLRNSPIPVSDYLVPHEALKFLGEKSGLLTNMEFVDVNNQPELARAFAQVYTVGTVTVEDFTYTCRTKEGLAAKGFTLGFSFDTRLKTNWSLRHLTVIAPEDKFESYAPTFAEMMGSYTIDEEWARNYVAQGQARLRQMQRQTSELVARNAQEIHSMMNAAYEERQASQDYIDYQRTNYIRGEQDWVSQMEGGTIYHTDAWGTKNTATGDYYEGQPYNYYNYNGDNPHYNEQMTPIDSRELYEQYVR